MKIPVIAGRSDDRTGLLTKLTDGARLLDTKQAAIDAWRAVHPELSPLHAVMLVIAQDTDDADNAVGILRKPDFHNGVFSDAILPIHSNLQDVDKALADLEEVEDPDSPIRVIVSVGMLREGWDVKNVYVICSLRASVSKILTEQTLGRGLRLAFGKPTGNEMLDTLEVVAHDRYEALINGVNKLREEFVDWKTIAESEAAVADGSTVARDAIGIAAMMSPAIDGATVAGAPVIADIESRIRHNVEAVSALDQRLRVRPGMPVLTLPVVKSTIVESLFSLADITDFEPFRAEGRRIGVNPENKLRRTLLGGEVTTDEAGKRTTRYVRRTATDTVFSEGDKVPVEVLVKQLTDDVMNSGAVPPRKGQPEMLNRIVAAFLDGLGKDNIESLAAYGRRAADAIVAVIRASRANRKSQTRLDDEVGLRVFDGIRIARKSTCNKGMPFERGVGYTGWVKSLYSQDWFDAESTEFALAGLLDDTDSIAYWLRLQVGDLPLGWAGDEHAYNPDFIAVDKDEIHWVIEGKADDTAKTPDVVAKQKAAIRWATHVSAATGASWRYVFVCEKDIKTAKGSWAALKGLAGAD